MTKYIKADVKIKNFTILKRALLRYFDSTELVWFNKEEMTFVLDVTALDGKHEDYIANTHLRNYIVSKPYEVFEHRLVAIHSWETK